MHCKDTSVVIEEAGDMGAGSLGRGQDVTSSDDTQETPYKAKGQYSLMGEGARRLTPPALQCALLCGGHHCKYESPLRWTQDQLALQGVYSHWITEDILAMARPSTASIATWNLIQQFHSWGIRSIINLQAAGEHAYCGPHLESSGFTYDPSVFMNNNIYYYNFAWRDYGAAGLRALLDAVKVLVFAVGEGRVAIHCHAGLGRTGVLIACYLVHALRVSADEAIRRVRARRARAVQTACQVAAVHHFEKYLLPQTMVFSIREPLKERNKQQEFGLLQHLHRQKAILHGMEERAFRYLPKIIYFLGERLLRACGCEDPGGGQAYTSNTCPTAYFLVVRARRNRNSCQEDIKCNCTEVLDPSDEKEMNETERVLKEGTVNALDKDENPGDTGTKTPVSSPNSPRGSQTHIETELNFEYSSSEVPSPEDRPGATPSQVAEALLMDHSSLSEERQRYMRNFQIDLNSRAAAFLRINTEEDLRIIAALLMEWLESLKMPVLDAQDLATIVVWGEKPKECLLRLELEDAILVEYLMRLVSRLRIISCEARAALLRRFAGALSQQGVRVRGVLQPPRSRARPMRAGTVASLTAFLARLHTCIRADVRTCTKCCPKFADSPTITCPAHQRTSLIIVQPSKSPKTHNSLPNIPTKHSSKPNVSTRSKSVSFPTKKSTAPSSLKSSFSLNDVILSDFGSPVKNSFSSSDKILVKSNDSLSALNKSLNPSNSSIEISLANRNSISTVAECHLD